MVRAISYPLGIYLVHWLFNNWGWWAIGLFFAIGVPIGLILEVFFYPDGSRRPRRGQ